MYEGTSWETTYSRVNSVDRKRVRIWDRSELWLRRRVAGSMA